MGGRREGIGSGFWVALGSGAEKLLFAKCLPAPCRPQGPGKATSARGHVPRGGDLPGVQFIRVCRAAALERRGSVQATPSSQAPVPAPPGASPALLPATSSSPLSSSTNRPIN